MGSVEAGSKMAVLLGTGSSSVRVHGEKCGDSGQASGGAEVGRAWLLLFSSGQLNFCPVPTVTLWTERGYVITVCEAWAGTWPSPSRAGPRLRGPQRAFARHKQLER